MGKAMSRFHSWVKAITPPLIWSMLQGLRWRTRTQTSAQDRDWQHEFPYLYKAHRSSATDYLCAFDHDDLQRAKHSVLWDGDWEEQTQRTLEVMEKLDLLRDGLQIVDYGCGVGRMTAALVERYTLQMYAVDRSPTMRRHATAYIDQRHYSSGAVRLYSDEELTSLVGQLSGKIDLIVLIEVAQHIPEPVLDEILPVLKSLLAITGRVLVYGNHSLDVDGAGRLHYMPIRTVLERHFSIVRQDRWPFQPEERYSFLCRA